MGRFRKGIIGNITQSIENVTDIAKEATIDRDAQIKMDGELQKIRSQLMLGGQGMSITKWTICALVTLVVSIISYKFVTATDTQAAMLAARDYAISVSPIIGILIGVFGFGKSFNKSRWSKKDG